MAPQVSLLSRVASSVFALLSVIMLLNLLRFRGTSYYFGQQRIPLVYTNEGRTDEIVGWQFAVTIAFLSVGLVSSTLLLCGQLACAARWALERKFLVTFHAFIALCYLLSGIILIIWLASDESPSQFDYTQAGPSASGLTITACITTMLAAALSFYGLCIIKVYRKENAKQGFIYAPSSVDRQQINRIVTTSSEYLQHEPPPPAEPAIVTRDQPMKKSITFDKYQVEYSHPQRSPNKTNDYSKSRRKGNSRQNKTYTSSRRSNPYSKASTNPYSNPHNRSTDGSRLPIIGERHYCRTNY